MPDLVLYRKYRPKNFSEVLGQDAIVKALSGSIKLGRTAHAYLFSGSRGTGKTSMARIFSHELKISNNDIFEIDAASNNGVDEIRALQEGVRTLPLDSLMKSYIIDEVHMLSKGAFNALLKTLEEPPRHVIFILATTELQKVPDTVISRCQTFQFRKPTETVLGKMVIAVARKEGFEISEDSANLIALLGDGSFRDTHGILQKVIATLPNKKIVREKVEELTGAPKSEVVNGIIKSILNKDLNLSLSLAGEAACDNIDSRILLKMLIHSFRQILLFRFSPQLRKKMELDLVESDNKFFAECAENKNAGGLSLVLSELLRAYEETRFSSISELPLELALVKLAGEK